ETICPVCGKSAMMGLTHPYCTTRHGIDGLTSFFHYAGPIRNFVQQIKYKFVSDMVSIFVSQIPQSRINALSHLRYNDVVIIPIPLHPRRLRHRGFNQAEKISECLSKRMSLPVGKNLLRRAKYTKPQVEKRTREERMKHMEDVFTVDTKHAVKIKGVFLVDDVCTTGATLRSAAYVLKKAGIPWVWGVTMAR
ncbi:MAG: phosphoribosyltransferase family protein, partial [Patescibacteria group bacterium]